MEHTGGLYVIMLCRPTCNQCPFRRQAGEEHWIAWQIYILFIISIQFLGLNFDVYMNSFATNLHPFLLMFVFMSDPTRNTLKVKKSNPITGLGEAQRVPGG